MTELKPCPFCGSSDVATYIVGKNTEYFYVACGDCGAETNIEIRKKEAIAAWNRRAKEGKDD